MVDKGIAMERWLQPASLHRARTSDQLGRVALALRSRDLAVAPRSERLVSGEVSGNAKPQLGGWLFIRNSLPLPSWGSAFPAVPVAAIQSLPIRLHDNKVVAPYRRAVTRKNICCSRFRLTRASRMRVRNGKQTADGTCQPVVFSKNRACQVRGFPLYSAHAK